MRAETPPTKNATQRATGRSSLKSSEVAGRPIARNRRASSRPARIVFTSTYPTQPTLTPAASDHRMVCQDDSGIAISRRSYA